MDFLPTLQFRVAYYMNKKVGGGEINKSEGSRKAKPKRVRFEVFKRNSFKVQ